MTKKLRNIFIGVFGIFAFLFAGFYFAGCGVDYSKISLVADVQEITLEVGESKDVFFEIENYQSGFEKIISVSEKSGNGSVNLQNGAKRTKTFSYTSPTYLANGKIKVTVTGVAGGDGALAAMMYDGGKECVIDVHVKQYATTMSSLNEMLYVSDDVDFIPDSSMFDLGANTTEKGLSYYMFTQREDFNLDTYYLSSIDNVQHKARFTDGTTGGWGEADIKQFDKVTFENGQLALWLDEEKENLSFVDDFGLLAVYDYSVDNVAYERIVYAITNVYVLPKIDVTISGGYKINGRVTFEEMNSGDKIIVVPNNTEMKEFIIKVEVEDSLNASPIVIENPMASLTEEQLANQPITVEILNDFSEGTMPTKLTQYWKVSKYADVAGELDFNFYVHYQLDRAFDDDNVNTTFDLIGELQIAPTTITINGTADPHIKLYNYYNSGSFGWVDLNVDVSANNSSVSPTYNGVYFSYDASVVELTYNGVSAIPNKIYADLSVPFKIRAKTGAEAGDTEVVLHLKSDILEGVEELSLDLQCEIVNGARIVEKVTGYQARQYFYLDYDGEAEDFSNIIYADEAFQGASATLLSGQNVAKFEFDESEPYTIINELYFINFRVSALSTGVGYYRIMLDNGISTDITFYTIKTLKSQTTSIKLADSGNSYVSYYQYDREENAEFDNILNVEILNPSTKNEIVFGEAQANLIVSANASGNGIIYESDNDNVTVSKNASGYTISTNKNGDSVVTFTLNGYNIIDFETVNATLTIYVNVTSYSLVGEFYFKRGNEYANINTVYHGENATVSDNSVVFTAVANHQDSTNFYRYKLTELGVARIFTRAREQNINYEYEVTLQNSDLTLDLVHEKLSDKCIYYYAQNKSGKNLDVATKIVIKKIYADGSDETKTILVSNKGLMFYGENFEFEYEEDDESVSIYQVSFSNSYEFDDNMHGTFDLESLTYTLGSTPMPIIINATLSQRGLAQKSNKMFSMEIDPVKFMAVENISLASNLTKLNFTSNQLSYTIGVYTYPVASTNKSIRVSFVKDSANLYTDLLTYSIDDSNKENGVYMITISCQDFYLRHFREIETIACPLAGKLYIYPEEWGGSYTVIGDKKPIILDIQYRNGSRANPYLIENASDVLAIGTNEVTLRSHYEIATAVDMSEVTNATPIGIIGDTLVGFKGTIIGSTSQAEITNIHISRNNFAAEINNKIYAGLFAQLAESAIIENVHFAGNFDIEIEKSANIALLAAINKGRIVNSGVTINTSTISATAELTFGGLVATNSGNIYQDFLKYYGTEGTIEVGELYNPGYHYSRDEERTYADGTKIVVLDDVDETELPQAWIYSGQTSKNMAKYNGFVTINSTQSVCAGGVAGATNGQINRYVDNNYKMLGYSGYAAYTQIKVVGTTPSVHLGGVAGDITSGLKSTIKNILVGGEVDAGDVSGGATATDCVGGLVGYANNGDISILDNTIRTFVRGRKNVAGIAGYENYNSNNDPVKWGTNNRIEAVDDGRTAFYSAMIIKYSEDTEISKSTFFAIGETKNRTYKISDENSEFYADFSAYTYSKRSVISSTSVDRASTSTTSFYGNYLVVDPTTFVFNSDLKYAPGDWFKKLNVNLGISGENKLELSGSDANLNSYNVYFMYYFGVDGLLSDSGSSQVIAQDEVRDLNFVKTNSVLYPFTLASYDVTFSTVQSSVLTFDANENISVSGVGFATVSLTSILNVNEKQKVYIYVVNYFNKIVEDSLYRTSASTTGEKVTDNSVVNIYGNSATNIFVVPDYTLGDTQTANGDMFSITNAGVLTFKNVAYILSKNEMITTTAVLQSDPGDRVSNVQVNKQSIVFRKTAGATEGQTDAYTLAPTLKLSLILNGMSCDATYKIVKPLRDEAGNIQRYDNGQIRYIPSSIDVDVVYKEAAKSIKPRFEFNAMETNNTLKDKIVVDSTNLHEKLFYQIYRINEDGTTENIQDKLPTSTSIINAYVISITEEDLFDLRFADLGNNEFEYTLTINRESYAFNNRFENNIYGEYIVYLYASQLQEGVTGFFRFRLDEASVNYISITNHSDFNDVSVSDQIVVPSQSGMLEIVVDPVEAVFNTITIANNAKNSHAGASLASFTFVYQKNSEGVVEYIDVPTFATNIAGKMTFSYENMKKYLDETDGAQKYAGKVYIKYLMPAYNVEDGVGIGFDVSVTYGDNEIQEGTISLVTKLSNYAKLSFVDKPEVDGSYYVARGLSYNMNLEYYGYTEGNITISSSNESLANVVNTNGKYVLQISSTRPARDEDRNVVITTFASKTVDGKVISYTHLLNINVMEYVLNYIYIDEVNEDIVKGMTNGVINDAIGNPYTLELDFEKLIEYDATNSDIVTEVNSFITSMSNNVKWNVYLYDGDGTLLEKNKVIRTDYYLINSFVVTPLKVYNASSGIYHFSSEVYYRTGNGGLYYVDSNANQKMYTEFSFEVHDQSTEDSPIPIETYEEFSKMQAGEWYILTKDITLPNADSERPFVPISEAIAGLDGNSFNIILSGDYKFESTTSVGVFATVDADTTLKNVNIVVASDTRFIMETATFNVGLLAAENEGVITNCSTRSISGALLSVVSSVTTSDAYVAGLVGNNTGFITHSRTQANIITTVNLAGFASKNSGHIASSYFMGATLESRTTSVDDRVAGFVIENANTGKIYTSYTSGNMAENPSQYQYYEGDSNYIKSTGYISGFVFINSGSVTDCYSNVNLSKQSSAGSDVCGFVFENGGSVTRCFSTSVLRSYATKSYGFAKMRSETSVNTSFEDCFYLSDSGRDINVSIELNNEENVVALSLEQFSKLNNFKNFVVAEGRDVNSVWFFSATPTGDNFNGSVCATNRIDLVAANTIATSKRLLDRVETVIDEDSGAQKAKYIYVYDAASPALGSMYNPIVIYDYKTMESYITSANDSSGTNYSYYRIVADIDYTESEYNSQLYKTRFMGYLEGNFTEVSNISIVSNENLIFAGLFSEIGSSEDAGAIGTIMNLTINPKATSFANAYVVGTLAGRISDAQLINLNFEADSNGMTMFGRNIVGGVVGLAIGNYRIKNVNSKIGARASYIITGNRNENDFDYTATSFTGYSYAGAIAGVLTGNGIVEDSLIEETTRIAVLGDRTGLMFGLVDENVNVDSIYIAVGDYMTINAYSYGGFVAGQVIGTMANIKVVGTISSFENFKKIPNTPVAIGGIAGLVTNGTLTNVIMTQSIKVATASDNAGIAYLGGIAGLVQGDSKIQNIEMTAALNGFNYVGGIAGGVTSGYARFIDAKVATAVSAGGRNVVSLGVGGAVGSVENAAAIELSVEDPSSSTNTIMLISINVTAYLYDGNVVVNVGDVIGHNEGAGHVVKNTTAVISSGNVEIYEFTKKNTITGPVEIDGTLYKEATQYKSGETYYIYEDGVYKRQAITEFASGVTYYTANNYYIKNVIPSTDSASSIKFNYTYPVDETILLDTLVVNVIA